MRAPGAQTRDVNFVETDVTGLTGFIIFRHSVTSDGLLIKNCFSFQGNVVKVNLCEKVCVISLDRLPPPFTLVSCWLIFDPEDGGDMFLRKAG
jgi:hypothetical protein